MKHPVTPLAAQGFTSLHPACNIGRTSNTGKAWPQAPNRP